MIYEFIFCCKQVIDGSNIFYMFPINNKLFHPNWLLSLAVGIESELIYVIEIYCSCSYDDCYWNNWYWIKKYCFICICIVKIMIKLEHVK